MGNTIKRNSVFIVVEALTDSSAFKKGEIIGNYKDDNMWIAKDLNGKKWQNLLTNLRNDSFYKIINQYSMEDIVYYLMDKNEDYQTVMWEMLVDAIRTTVEEIRVTCIDDIYRYVIENLI